MDSEASQGHVIGARPNPHLLLLPVKYSCLGMVYCEKSPAVSTEDLYRMYFQVPGMQLREEGLKTRVVFRSGPWPDCSGKTNILTQRLCRMSRQFSTDLPVAQQS